MYIKFELYIVLEVEVNPRTEDEVDCQSFEEETSEANTMLQAKNNSMMITSKLNEVTLAKVIEFVPVNKSKYRNHAAKEVKEISLSNRFEVLEDVSISNIKNKIENEETKWKQKETCLS